MAILKNNHVVTNIATYGALLNRMPDRTPTGINDTEKHRDLDTRYSLSQVAEKTAVCLKHLKLSFRNKPHVDSRLGKPSQEAEEKEAA